MTHLNLSYNDIEAVWKGRLRTARSLPSQELRIELRGVVKCLVFVCRHLALLALCHLVIRQTTRKGDILYTYSVVSFGLALSI